MEVFLFHAGGELGRLNGLDEATLKARRLTFSIAST